MRNPAPHDQVRSDISYQHSLGRAKSVQGMLNVKKKRKKLYAVQNAITQNDKETWERVSKKRREIATPLKNIENIKNTISALLQGNSIESLPSSHKRNLKSKLNIIVKQVDRLSASLSPLLMNVENYKNIHEKYQQLYENTMKQNVELDRMLVKSCQSIFNGEQTPLYADETFLKEIIPSSIYHQRAWIQGKKEVKKKTVKTPKRMSSSMKNKIDHGVPAEYLEETMELARTNRTLIGNTAGNMKSTKPQNKVDLCAKKVASKERQDVPCSMVDHTPIFVADPDSFSGLAGSIRTVHNKATFNKKDINSSSM